MDLTPYTQIHTMEAFYAFKDRYHVEGDIRPEGIAHVRDLIGQFAVPVEYGLSRYGGSTYWQPSPEAMKRFDVVVSVLYDRMTGKRTVERLLTRDEVILTGFRLPPITSDMHYAIALHEFGHASLHLTHGPLIASSEISACRWALDNARYWTRAMSHGLLVGLWTYVDPSQSFRQKHTVAEFEAFAARIEARELRG